MTPNRRGAWASMFLLALMAMLAACGSAEQDVASEPVEVDDAVQAEPTEPSAAETGESESQPAESTPETSEPEPLPEQPPETSEPESQPEQPEQPAEQSNAAVPATLDDILPARGQLRLATEWIEPWDPTWAPDLAVDCPTPAEPSQFVERQFRIYTEYERSFGYEALVFGYEFGSEDAAAVFYAALAEVLNTCDSSREVVTENLREVIEGPVETTSLLAVPEPSRFARASEEPTAIFVLRSGRFLVVVDDWESESPLGPAIQGEIALRVQENLLALAEGREISQDTPYEPRDIRTLMAETMLAGSSTRYAAPSVWFSENRPMSVFDSCGGVESPLLRNEFVATARNGEFFFELANANIGSHATLLKPGVDPVEFAEAMDTWSRCLRSATDSEPRAPETLVIEGHGEVEAMTTAGLHPTLGTSHIRSVVDGSAVFVIATDINVDEAGRDLSPEIAKAIGAFLDRDW